MIKSYSPEDQTPCGIVFTMFDENGRPFLLNEKSELTYSLRTSITRERATEFQNNFIMSKSGPAFGFSKVYNKSGQQISQRLYQNGTVVEKYVESDATRVPGIVRHLTR